MQSRKHNYVYRFILLFVFFSLCTFAFKVDAAPRKQHILILDSYYRSYERTDRVLSGIESILMSDNKYEIDIEHLNAIPKYDFEATEKLFNGFSEKYNSNNYDLIITLDKDAFDFVNIYRKELFNNVPVVFSGIIDFDQYGYIDKSLYTGIYEEDNITKTIDIALQQNHSVDKLVIIRDKTRTGYAIEDIIKNHLAVNYEGISLSSIGESNINEVVKELRTKKGKYVIYLGAPSVNDENGNLLTLNEMLNRIALETKMPIYSSWELYIGEGIVGGLLVNEYNNGQFVGTIAQKVLDGKSLEDMPIQMRNSKRFIFDYNELINQNISLSSIPLKSIILNQPPATVIVQRSYIWISVLLVFIILAIINIFMLVNIKKRKLAEKGLKESEEQLRCLINGMPDIVCFKNENSQWLEANKACIEFFGLEHVQYKGKTSRELYGLSKYAAYKDEKQSFMNCLVSDNMAWDERELVSYEETIKMSDDNSAKTLDIIKVPLFHANGSRKGIIVLGRDITEKKNASENLYKSEEILRATLNATADGILVVANDRRIIDYNNLFRKMWKIPLSLFESADDEKLLEYVINQLNKPEEFRDWVNGCYTNEKTDFKVTYFRDGRVYEVFSEPLINKGIIEGRVWSFKDITMRKRMEKEFRESEERYRRLVELSPDAIYMSVDGKNIFSNTTGAKLLDVDDAKELIGKPILGFVYSDFYDTSNKKIKNVQNGKAVLPLIEKKLIKSDGSIIDIEVASTYFEYKGKTALMSVIRDITERRKAQELRIKVEENTRLLKEAIEYDKLKTEFFANISHEFRTPLNIILGAQQLFRQILKDNDLGENKEKVEKYLKIMKQNCYRLLRLVNNLIDITRIDAGFFSIQPKNYDIVNIVEEITLSVAEYIENKGISLLFDTDVEEKVIACDADKIERIILNLLSNATKFTEPGDSIEVYVEDRIDKIAISIKDTGIGIPEDKQDIIFERFRQVDKSFIRNHEGSGIGLSIVKSLVELHNGAVELESELGKGTRITIELPVTVLVGEKEVCINDNMYQSKIERIDVEFSDIYL